MVSGVVGRMIGSPRSVKWMKRAADMLAVRIFSAPSIMGAAAAFSAFRQVHGQVAGESERDGQNSD